ncbi:DUF4159 domain-containing protein [Aureliella helgolandensis]|uniref:DUF4159 domain-containing protein n=1 Tax=Aureliella helgolandensis TaxID=2527968 RepID=A0A518FZQ5_9BACT|nr:DUF4159 domain-containing protein [Aureliella helgolandensis]QDV21839.1 hypothetical protein Q31a_01180 [Aureliella helgolandensis]
MFRANTVIRSSFCKPRADQAPHAPRWNLPPRLIAAVLAILAIFPIAPTTAVAQRSNSQIVEDSIQLAVKYLLINQLEDGGWAEINRYNSGVTGLVTLALLNSGLAPEHPQIARALLHLKDREPDMVYTVSLQTMVFCAANPNRYATQIQHNAQWLFDAQLSNGGWDYNKNDARGDGDPSNSQFALLALHEAQRTGSAHFEPQVWGKTFALAQKYWESLQRSDGAFPYNRNDAPRGSMTCAGIASLVITGAQLDALEASVTNGIECCGSAGNPTEDRIQKGLDWLAANFSVTRTPVSNVYQLYYLYALERVGRLTGRRFIGEHDWYREGASELISQQDKVTGKYISRTSAPGGNTFSETAFGLLFLSKGKRQIVVSRLKHGIDQDWNHHSTAIQNLTAHTEQAWKRDLAWQTIDLKRAKLADLLESPVLFLSGSNTPVLSQEDKLLLKEYVEQGGFIYAEACQGNGCDGRAFEDYFRKLVVELFDQPLEKLSPDHPIWYAEARVLPKDLPPGAWLYGVQTCCRLGVVYSPVSLSCRWELHPAYGAPVSYPEPVQSELNTFTKMGINVLSYATGKELKEKLDTVTILEDKLPQVPTDRGTFFLPILKHNAGFDDATRTIPNLMQWFGKELPFQLSSEKRLINIASADLEQYPVVFMHGRGRLKLSELEREALRSYLTNGGFLFADSICSDQAFTDSFRTEMEIILNSPLSPLADTDPLLTPVFNGFDIRRVTLLDPDKSGDQILTTKRTIAPRLEIGKADNRTCVVFSPLDLSCALESRHSLQCRGYLREDAARIGINTLLFALQQ